MHAMHAVAVQTLKGTTINVAHGFFGKLCSIGTHDELQAQRENTLPT